MPSAHSYLCLLLVDENDLQANNYLGVLMQQQSDQKWTSALPQFHNHSSFVSVPVSDHNELQCMICMHSNRWVNSVQYSHPSSKQMSHFKVRLPPLHYIFWLNASPQAISPTHFVVALAGSRTQSPVAGARLVGVDRLLYSIAPATQHLVMSDQSIAISEIKVKHKRSVCRHLAQGKVVKQVCGYWGYSDGQSFLTASCAETDVPRSYLYHRLCIPGCFGFERAPGPQCSL